MLPPHGQRGHRAHTRELLQHLGRRFQQAGVTTEFVQYKALNAFLIVGRQQGPGAVQMRKGTAPVNVGDQQAAGIGMPCHAQVDDVAVHQVDLGGRACAFDHDHIVCFDQLVQCRGNLRPDFVAALVPGCLAQGLADLTEQHHLAACIGLGLEQQRVHAHIRFSPGRQRLKVLGTADFAKPVCRSHNACVVAHVLRLEWRDLQALSGVVAAQRRGQPALARPAGGAQHHDAPGAHALRGTTTH